MRGKLEGRPDLTRVGGSPARGSGIGWGRETPRGSGGGRSGIAWRVPGSGRKIAVALAESYELRSVLNCLNQTESEAYWYTLWQLIVPIHCMDLAPLRTQASQRCRTEFVSARRKTRFLQLFAGQTSARARQLTGTSDAFCSADRVAWCSPERGARGEQRAIIDK